MKLFLLKCIPIISSISLPILHLGVFYRLIFDKAVVDKDSCSCECFDRVFKGDFEPKISGYKHIYFNATWQTTLIWAESFLHFVAFYETMKHACDLISRRQIEWRMMLVFVTCIYPNYYSWWGYFNYLNDEYFSQLLHQIVFTTSELYVTILAVLYFNKNKIQNGKLLSIAILITLFHILYAAKDQFLSNVFMWDGKTRQVSRDLGLMTADIMNLIILSKSYHHLSTKPNFNSLNFEEFVLAIFLIIIASVFLAIF